MSLNSNNLWIEDIDKVIGANPCISELEGKSVIITGIGGLLCSAIADIIIRYNETHMNPIIIYAGARTKEKIIKRFGRYTNCSYFQFFEYDATKEDINISLNADYIIHGASNSSPDKIINEPVETMVSNFVGLKNLLCYAKKKEVKRLLFISSSEVYGKKEGDAPFHENQYGFIDLLNSRNSYSVGKRAGETLCVAFTEEYGVDSVIVRPGHIYGPTATKGDKHVSSQWVFDAARGKDIVMKSEGNQIRSYCYCLDAASAILTVLIKGEKNHAYNISNPDSIISIKQMAEFLSEYACVKLKTEIPSIDEKKRFNPMSNSSLDSTSLISLGWRGCFDARIGFEHTIQILKEMDEIV